MKISIIALLLTLNGLVAAQEPNDCVGDTQVRSFPPCLCILCALEGQRRRDSSTTSSRTSRVSFNEDGEPVPLPSPLNGTEDVRALVVEESKASLTHRNAFELVCARTKRARSHFYSFNFDRAPYKIQSFLSKTPT